MDKKAESATLSGSAVDKSSDKDDNGGSLLSQLIGWIYDYLPLIIILLLLMYVMFYCAPDTHQQNDIQMLKEQMQHTTTPQMTTMLLEDARIDTMQRIKNSFRNAVRSTLQDKADPPDPKLTKYLIRISDCFERALDDEIAEIGSRDTVPSDDESLLQN